MKTAASLSQTAAAIKRLIYRSKCNGILENDLILGSFAKKHLHTLQIDQLSLFERLLTENDWDVYYWISKSRIAPECYAQSPLLAQLQKHAYELQYENSQ